MVGEKAGQSKGTATRTGKIWECLIVPACNVNRTSGQQNTVP